MPDADAPMTREEAYAYMRSAAPAEPLAPETAVVLFAVIAADGSLLRLTFERGLADREMTANPGAQIEEEML